MGFSPRHLPASQPGPGAGPSPLSVMEAALPMGTSHSLWVEQDRGGRAGQRGFSDRVVQGLWWCYIEQDHDAVVVALVEHVGRDHHAGPGAAALVLIDGHLHGVRGLPFEHARVRIAQLDGEQRFGGILPGQWTEEAAHGRRRAA